jgi:Transport protein Avl9
MMQFSLISLIPGLIRKLQDCADPQLSSLEENMVAPTSLRTSERASCMTLCLLFINYVFADMSQYSPMWDFHCIYLGRLVYRMIIKHKITSIQGSFFGPYTPLQQLDVLADHDTKSYVVGSTNSLLLAQKDRYCDILINVSRSNKVPGFKYS